MDTEFKSEHTSQAGLVEGEDVLGSEVAADAWATPAVAFEAADPSQDVTNSLAAPERGPTAAGKTPAGRWTGHLPEDDLRMTFTRSSGPGGQHVNKTSTRVQVELGIGTASCLSDTEREALRDWLSKNRRSAYVQSSDSVLVACSGSRSQADNRTVALRRLTDLITSALTPTPKRIPVATPRSVIEHRKKAKRHRSQTKAARRDTGPRFSGFW
jgi:ribosome-associated protein